MTNRLHTTIIVAILVVCSLITIWSSWQGFFEWNNASSTPPDWTVAPCAKWGPDLDQTATLPAYTYTDRCAMNGEVIYPQNLSSIEDFGN